MIRIALLSTMLAAPVAAQDVPFDADIVRTCLSTDEPFDCVGLAAYTCEAKSASNVGYGLCLGLELEVWDSELNRVYGALIGLTEANDAEMKELGSAVPPATPILRSAQRAWIAWRDAQCDYARSIFGGGTGGGPAATDCLMHLTAEQALRLDVDHAGQGG